MYMNFLKISFFGGGGGGGNPGHPPLNETLYM